MNDKDLDSIQDKFMDGYNSITEKIVKGNHDFKGHFNGYDEGYVRWIIGSMHFSLFMRFLDSYKRCRGNTANLEDAVLKGYKKKVGHGTCNECGEHVSFDLDGCNIIAQSSCKYPKGHPPIVAYLDVPSGEILLFNDFRHIYNPDDDRRNDKEKRIDLNTNVGIKEYSEFYAARGMAIHFVGNTCPGVYQSSETKLSIGRDLKGKELGSICTDLWWYCAVDRKAFEKKAGKSVAQYQKEYHDTGAWPEIVRAKVKPGRYKTVGRYHLCSDNSRVYSTIEWVREI